LALAFLFYLRQEALPLSIILPLEILQRETILIVFASTSGIALLLQHGQRHFNGFVFFWSVACGAAYLLMRTTLLPVLGATGQTDPAAFLENLRTFQLTRDFIFQGFFLQNLLGRIWPPLSSSATNDPGDSGFRRGSVPFWS
jgi:hypothetical protein